MSYCRSGSIIRAGTVSEHSSMSWTMPSCVLICPLAWITPIRHQSIQPSTKPHQRAALTGGAVSNQERNSHSTPFTHTLDISDLDPICFPEWRPQSTCWCPSASSLPCLSSRPALWCSSSRREWIKPNTCSSSVECSPSSTGWPTLCGTWWGFWKMFLL